MAIRKIVKLGEDDILRKRCRKVDKFDKRLHVLLDDMADTMYEADGAGLAAPQVGILKRVVVIDVGEGLIELVNPEIIATEGTQMCIEGCLSVPGKRGKVERPAIVRVHAQDRDGNHIELEGEEFLANALCHELDHLDGIIYVDKMLEDVTDQYGEDADSCALFSWARRNSPCRACAHCWTTAMMWWLPSPSRTVPQAAAISSRPAR